MEPSGGEKQSERFSAGLIKCNYLLSSVQGECDNFECMLWFESLLFYGFDEQTALQKGNGDNSLLPSIVEKVILSKLAGRK